MYLQHIKLIPEGPTLDYRLKPVHPPNFPCNCDGLQGLVMPIWWYQAYSSHQLHSIQCNMRVVWVNRPNSRQLLENHVPFKHLYLASRIRASS